LPDDSGDCAETRTTIVSSNSERPLCHSAQCVGDRNSINSQTSRILHFCDGTMVVDENENGIIVEHYPDQMASNSNEETRVGVQHRRWKVLQMLQTPSMGGLMQAGATLGRKSLRVVDYVGGGFASLLGITDPKYATEINQMNDQEESDRKRQETISKQMSGWTPQSATQIVEQQI
jgi:hypothetical protein